MEGVLLVLAGVIGSGLGFWLAVIALLVLMSIFSEEQGVWATVTFVAGILFLQFIAKCDIVGFFKTHSIWALSGYALAYVGIGLVWAVVKWTSYAHGQRRKYNKIRKDFLKHQRIGGDEIPNEKKAEWAKYLDNHRSVESGFHHYSSDDATSVIPDVTENKAAIIRWMTYWLPSMVYTVCNDPVRRLFVFLYEQIGVKLQEIANHAFKGTENDFLTPDQQKAAMEAEAARYRNR